MARNTTVEVQGSVHDAGTLAGKGTLTFRFADPASARLSLDYAEPDRLRLTIDAGGELHISRNKTLALSGNLGRDFLRGRYDGGLKLTFEIPKTASVELDHRFDADGRTTTLRLSGTF